MNLRPITIRRALISLTDKTGIVELAKALHAQKVEILSTGGTAKVLRENKIPVTEVSDFTGFPEIMDGRVKTLHPRIHGGVLGLRDAHKTEAKKNNVDWIDLVVCNLYPFKSTVMKKGVSEDEVFENIDIGGPSMIRSAGKNVGWVAVVTDTADYPELIDALKSKKGISFELRKKLSGKAFAHTGYYDSMIAKHFQGEDFPSTLALPFERSYPLRYGENPHQQAAIYQDPLNTEITVLGAKVLQGKQLSYNNILDSEAALNVVREFSEPGCAIIKHTNPCGAAMGKDILQAYQRAYAADSMSAFGGIIALNRPCDGKVATKINAIFVEIILAPSFTKEALKILSAKPNLRLLEINTKPVKKVPLQYRFIEGGVLVQEKDVKVIREKDVKVVTKKKPAKKELADMMFAWSVLKHMRSNAILVAGNQATIGVGVGQVSRVDAVDIALKKANGNFKNNVLASDAFFPFRDSIDKIAQTGIKAIIQPGGSVRDQEVIDACDEHGIAMVFTGIRCFKH